MHNGHGFHRHSHKAQECLQLCKHRRFRSSAQLCCFFNQGDVQPLSAQFVGGVRRTVPQCHHPRPRCQTFVCLTQHHTSFLRPTRARVVARDRAMGANNAYNRSPCASPPNPWSILAPRVQRGCSRTRAFRLNHDYGAVRHPHASWRGGARGDHRRQRRHRRRQKQHCPLLGLHWRQMKSELTSSGGTCPRAPLC